MSMSKNIESYLEDQTKAAERSYRFSVIVIVALSVITVGYFQWMRGELQTQLTPDNLASVAVSETSRFIPEATETLEKEIASSIPWFVSEAMNTFIDTTVPEVREGAEAMFNKHATDVAGIAVATSTDAFEAVVKSKAVELMEASAHEPGVYTSEAFFADIEDSLAAEMSRRSSPTPVESAGHKLDQAEQALRNINAQLVKLAEMENPTRNEVLKRRLVAAWWSYLKTHDVFTAAGEESRLYVGSEG
jgi:hypothetical protein